MTVMYRKIINNADMEKSQKDLDRLGELTVKNGMKIYPKWYPVRSSPHWAFDFFLGILSRGKPPRPHTPLVPGEVQSARGQFPGPKK